MFSTRDQMCSGFDGKGYKQRHLISAELFQELHIGLLGATDISAWLISFRTHKKIIYSGACVNVVFHFLIEICIYMPQT